LYVKVLICVVSSYDALYSTWPEGLGIIVMIILGASVQEARLSQYKGDLVYHILDIVVKACCGCKSKRRGYNAAMLSNKLCNHHRIHHGEAEQMRPKTALT
jgi:hypothetical protein